MIGARHGRMHGGSWRTEPRRGSPIESRSFRSGTVPGLEAPAPSRVTSSEGEAVAEGAVAVEMAGTDAAAGSRIAPRSHP